MSLYEGMLVTPLHQRVPDRAAERHQRRLSDCDDVLCYFASFGRWSSFQSAGCCLFGSTVAGCVEYVVFWVVGHRKHVDI